VLKDWTKDFRRNFSGGISTTALQMWNRHCEATLAERPYNLSALLRLKKRYMTTRLFKQHFLHFHCLVRRQKAMTRQSLIPQPFAQTRTHTAQNRTKKLNRTVRKTRCNRGKDPL